MTAGGTWSGEVIFDSLGTVIRVRSTDASIIDLVSGLFRHFPASDLEPDVDITVTGDGERYHVDSRGERAVDGGSRDKAIVQILAIVNEATVYGVESLVIHAGAVAFGGEVIVLPASAEAGKSTLVAACLRAGFEYVTDEAVVVISEDGALHSYPKCLWLTAESRTLLGVDDTDLSCLLDDRYKSPVLPEELGGTVAVPPIRLSHMVLPERGGATTSLEPMGGAEAAAQLLRHCFNRYDRPRDWFELTAELARGMGAWRLSYGDPGEAAVRLQRLMMGSQGLM